MDAAPDISGDIRTWFFLVLSLLIGVLAYILKGDRDRMDQHGKRLGNHAQRLTKLDGKTEEETL